VDLLAVDGEGIDLVGEDVADDAAGEVGLPVDQGRGLDAPGLLLDLFPGPEQGLELALEELGRELLAGGPDDEAARVLGRLSLAIFRRRARSSRSSILRLTPTWLDWGMWTRNRPGREIWVVTRGPLVEMASLVTWTRSFWPFLTTSWMAG
jgi:hypothetical protein